MSEHITKQTELNKYSQENNLDGEKLWYRFGQLTKDQEQIRTSTREFVKECANEIRTETDSRNSKLVEKILDKHNRLIEVLLTKSSFLKTLIDELSIELSNDNKLTKKQINQISKQLASTITKILKNKTTKETKTTIKQVDPVSLLTNETIVNQFSKNFRSRFSQKYKQTLSKDKQIANRFNIKKNITRISNVVKSFSEAHNKIQEQFKKQQFTQNQINNISVFRKSGKITKAIKTNQVEKLRLYNDYVINRTSKTIDRIERSFANALWFKFKNKLSRKLGDFKQSIIDGAKSLFSTKAIKTGFGFVGKVLSTVLLKPIMFVGKVLISSLKGLFKLGLGMVKSAFGLTGKIFKYLNENLLKKIAKFIFTPPGMFITGYLWAFFKDKIGGIFDGVSEKVKSGIEGITKTVRKIKTSIAKGLLKVVNGIATNKVLIAFLTRDSATIAQFMDNLKIKFREKFGIVQDFFRDLTLNIVANVAAGGLSWAGALIGTCLGGPLGSIIGSLAGAGLAMLIGKLFANKLFELPDNDADAADRLNPLYRKYGTFTKADSYKETGLADKIQQRINKLQSERDDRMQKYNNGETDEFHAGDIDEKIKKLKLLQENLGDFSQEEDHSDFYEKVKEILNLTYENDVGKGWKNSLPNTGDELKELVNGKDIKENLGYTWHKIDGEDINRGPGYSLVYKQLKMQILNKLYYTARKINMNPERFCELYESHLTDALDMDYSDQLLKTRDKTGWTDFNTENFELSKNTKLRDYLTKPIVAENGRDGIFIPSKKADKDDIKSFRGKLLKRLKINIVENYQEISEKSYDVINNFVNNLVSGKGKNCLSSIIDQICNNDQEQKKFLMENFPLESWFRKYLNQNLFDYYYINDAGSLSKLKDANLQELYDGFKSFIVQFLDIPDIKSVISEEVKKKQGFMEKFNNLRKRLKGVVDEQDVEVQSEMMKLEENEAKMKKEMEDDPEYKVLRKKLEDKKKEYNELLDYEAKKQQELVEKSKSVEPMVAVLKKEAEPEEDISEEEK